MTGMVTKNNSEYCKIKKNYQFLVLCSMDIISIGKKEFKY